MLQNVSNFSDPALHHANLSEPCSSDDHVSTSKYSSMNHSRIVGTYVMIHSIIVEKESIGERHDSVRTACSVGECQHTRTIGIFQKYPVGICNPAFTGMYLWELTSSHELNDYKICQYHLMKSGIILYGKETYVFTQFTNNDINSHIKILLRGEHLGILFVYPMP